MDSDPLPRVSSDGREDLSSLTKEAILVIARERGLRGRYGMSKKELIDALIGVTAPTDVDLSSLTKEAILVIARERGLRGRYGMSKQELIDALIGVTAPTDVDVERTATASIIEIVDLYLLEEVSRSSVPVPVDPLSEDARVDSRPRLFAEDSTAIDGGTGLTPPSPSPPPVLGEESIRTGRSAPRPSSFVTVGSLYERDTVPLGVLGTAVIALITLYVILNRLIADRFVLPIGTSIRLYEVVLVLVGLLWLVWQVSDPHPMPYGAPAITGVLLVVVVGLAPFIHAPTLNAYQANGAERGLFRMFIFVTLFLASYHVAFRLRSGLMLLAVVIGASVGQAAFAVYEFVTERPVEFLDGVAVSVGLIPDPLSVRSELEGVFQRATGEIRAVATAPNPIVLSSVIAVGVLLSGVWILYAKDKRARRWLAAAAVLLLLGLPVSNSRTGFVIIVVLAVPLLILLINKLPAIVTWSIAMILAMGLAFAVSPETPRLLLNSFTDPGNDPNTAIRLERFERLPELLEPRPYIGAGYLTHDPQIQIFDNAFNLALIELGVVGLIVFLTFVGAAIVRSWSGSQRAASREAILPIAGVVGSLALLAGGATFDAWTFDQFFPTCLILLGLGLGRSAVVLRRDNPDRIQVHTGEMVRT